MRACLIILLMSVCINGCANVTTDSVVWRAQDVSLADYQSLQMLDVFNASGSPISNETLAYCSKRLRQELESRGLEIVERRPESGNTLLVQTSVVYFVFKRPVVGSAVGNRAMVNESVVNLQIVMRDQSLHRTVAEIKNVTVYGSNFYRLYSEEESLFRQIANNAAAEIEKLIHSDDPQ